MLAQNIWRATMNEQQTKKNNSDTKSSRLNHKEDNITDRFVRSNNNHSTDSTLSQSSMNSSNLKNPLQSSKHQVPQNDQQDSLRLLPLTIERNAEIIENKKKMFLDSDQQQEQGENSSEKKHSESKC
ncbi:unnamed protein product [Rotaria sp. Silwood2]|nr:unnamed protein product [Rotaria sp. Silwood2]CAF2784809.1 unnamed protein product [Rotaria sp. Silwood2]CAF3253276.1 unnamed protein product [Rotaria sp. Silwood2]CAF3350027.1 unnamed protein product [Rotaria sp. Silwood2]